MKILQQLLIIFILCLFGELISAFLPVIIPANVISMIMLLVLLMLKIIKEEHIKESAQFLLANLTFFFVPLTVSILDNFHLIRENIFAILFICIFTTFLTFAATAYTVSGVIKIMDKRRRAKYE